jgi:hypothetical protein
MIDVELIVAAPQTAFTTPAPTTQARTAPAGTAPAGTTQAATTPADGTATPMTPAQAAGFAAVSRAFVAAAADLVIGVQRAMIGPENIRTARDNAWAATLADRAANEARAELTREVAALIARPAQAGPRRSMAKAN